MALNNLAWLLALREPHTGEALDLIGRAIELVGPEAGLLDTRAMVYLKTGRSELAIRDLEAVLGATPTASAYFHLAQAQHLARNRAAAAVALRKARDMGLVAERIDPLERPAYERLQAALALR
jgi:regulator of sirC expression with transglutaminase-like and TPR domain